jgi:hypothetical protein
MFPRTKVSKKHPIRHRNVEQTFMRCRSG